MRVLCMKVVYLLILLIFFVVVHFSFFLSADMHFIYVCTVYSEYATLFHRCSTLMQLRVCETLIDKYINMKKIANAMKYNNARKLCTNEFTKRNVATRATNGIIQICTMHVRIPNFNSDGE